MNLLSSCQTMFNNPLIVDDVTFNASENFYISYAC